MAIFDCDECMSYEYYNLMADLINEKNSSQDFDEWSVFIIRQLLRNNSFREQFRQRFEVLLSSTFSTPNLIQHIKEMPLSSKQTFRLLVICDLDKVLHFLWLQ